MGQKLMNCMEAALKSSLRHEIAATTQHVADDWLPGAAAGAGVTGISGEEFFVDDLLDFSNGVLDDGGEDEEEEEKDSLSVSSADLAGDDDGNSNSGSYSCTGSSDDSEAIFAGGLAIPVDDVAELEWVSRFVDDSLSEFPLLYPTEKRKAENSVSQTRFDPVFLKPPRFPSPVPVKTRSKRPRTEKQSTTSYQPSESSSASSCPVWSSSSIGCLLTIPREPEGKLKTKTKKKKTNRTVQAGSVLFQRRCSHCGVQKTPQWRAGPFGAKTLCNACGVRYKSGRLFPEYRPAGSPTFSMEIHSNSHRKVLEMRKKKEMASGRAGELAQMVPSF